MCDCTTSEHNSGEKEPHRKNNENKACLIKSDTTRLQSFLCSAQTFVRRYSYTRASWRQSVSAYQIQLDIYTGSLRHAFMCTAAWISSHLPLLLERFDSFERQSYLGQRRYSTDEFMQGLEAANERCPCQCSKTSCRYEADILPMGGEEAASLLNCIVLLDGERFTWLPARSMRQQGILCSLIPTPFVRSLHHHAAENTPKGLMLIGVEKDVV